MCRDNKILIWQTMEYQSMAIVISLYITSTYIWNYMLKLCFRKVKTCLNLPEEGEHFWKISIIKSWKGKLKTFSCFVPSQKGLQISPPISCVFCSQAWIHIMGLKSQLSTQYQPRCLLHKRPKLLDFYHNLYPPHFDTISPYIHSPSPNFSKL